MTRLSQTQLEIQIAEHRARARDERRARLEQVEEILRKIVMMLGGASGDAPIDLVNNCIQRGERHETDAQIYRARCPVLASDVGPQHTAARVLAFALANGWVELKRGGRFVKIGRAAWRINIVSNPTHASTVTGFCSRHAKASGMAPLDVLAAIGAMP